jgi:oligopeptide transport system permease protein
MPPRIPGIENIGIFDGTSHRTIRAENFPNWEHVYRGTVREYDVHTGRDTYVPMMEIRVAEYTRRAEEMEMEIERGVTPDPTDMYFWFGSDQLGRDMFTRVWIGTRISLILGISVVFINLSIGMVVGSIIGYYGGWIDLIFQRIMEVLGNIPFVPLAILIILMLGSGLQSLIIVFLIQGWIGPANNVRVQFYRFKNREYVLASRTLGASDPRVMFRHILPNGAGTIITAIALSVPLVIFMEAFLAYLGLGINAPNPSLGTLLLDGQQNLLHYPFLIVSPAIIIVLLMLSFNLLGNGLRDAFNPALRT